MNLLLLLIVWGIRVRFYEKVCFVLSSLAFISLSQIGAGCFTVNCNIAFISVSPIVCFLTLRKRGCWVLYGELYHCFYVRVSDCLFSNAEEERVLGALR